MDNVEEGHGFTTVHGRDLTKRLEMSEANAPWSGCQSTVTTFSYTGGWRNKGPNAASTIVHTYWVLTVCQYCAVLTCVLDASCVVLIKKDVYCTRRGKSTYVKIEWKYNVWSQWTEGSIVRHKQRWWENLQGVYIPGTLRERWAVNQVKFQPNEAFDLTKAELCRPARLSQCLFLKRMDYKWKWLE